MKKLFNFFYGNWFKPIMFNILAAPAYLVSISIGSDPLEAFGTMLFLLGLIWIVTSLVVQLFKRQWRNSFYTLLFIFIAIMIIAMLQ